MRGKTIILMVALAGLVPAMRAAERITLRNGFEMQCDHHGQVGARVRLYLNPNEDNYLEIEPKNMLEVEWVADPPSPPDSAQTSQPSSTNANPDAKLNQEDLGEMLAKAGKEHNLDVDLLASVVKAESGGNARAVSRAGARGLMQLMPGTANDLGVQDSFKPEQNVRGGSAYLDSLLTRYHDNLAQALAAYNAGPGAVDKYHGIPPYHETRAYVARVIHEFNRRVLARQAQARHAIAVATAP
jgi:soluble lytic murein transglycosylase-like protein